ncbi:MAG: antibiotic biosynthesis monooxygenase [Candidatus Eremiobacteraeota bacterium]|nr:antibiotic biosynthesis monooxygenase [Candidatus Eremiobacteraeota bacterium]
MIFVVAIITAKPGRLEEALTAFRANVPAVRAETGCIEYAAAVDAEGLGGFQAPIGPDTFAVIEKWESVEALKAHAVAPHMKAYASQTKDALASRVIHVLAPA